jgi:16S rRNA (adenine1518-N6/adenine1519-N6)-dimethyltransferase
VSDLSAKKSLGQHWLRDAESLNAICDAAKVAEGDNVFEIGPGMGDLTGVLMFRGATIYAVEFDPEAFAYLQDRFARQWDLAVYIEQGDIRKYDLRRLPTGYKVVANIPYYLTSHLIQLLSETANPPRSATLLVQKEVAERVCAEAGDMSLLSVTTQFYWQASLGSIVTASKFTPPPKVDSQVLVLKRRSEPLFADVDEKQFFRLVKAGFANRRKTLLNSLSNGLQISKVEAKQVLDKAQISPTARPQELSLTQWHRLYVEAK